jgi:hypothetical protein
MVESTISLLAWMVVILIQAIIHYFILGARRRGDDGEVPVLKEVEEQNQSVSKQEATDEPIPRMMPHAISEDEDEEESFDGDEPQMFFELLEQTGCEMIRSCTSLENLVQEQIVKVDGVAGCVT